jgi:hypothetical protein
MGRKNRSKRIATVRPAPQPASADGRLQGHNKAVEGSKKLTVSSIVYPIVVGILAGIIRVVLTRWWTELGDHEKTRGELAREKESKGNVITGRDQLKEELTALKKENSELKSLHPILGFYGSRAKIIASYDFKKEAGARLIIGACPKAPCFRVTFHGIRELDKEQEVANLSWSGSWEGLHTDVPSDRHAFGIRIPLKKGCSHTIKSRVYDITLVIEEDRRMDVRAGIGISPGTYPGSGFISSVGGGDCQELEKKLGGSLVRRPRAGTLPSEAH